QSVLYLQYSFALRLALKLFRREPAIAVFDWLFTPTHTSSPYFSTYVGSGLQSVLPNLHPGHGYLTRFRVYDRILIALFRLAFATAPCFPLNLAYDRNSPVHAAKGTPSRKNCASTTCRHTVSGTISPPSGVLFTFPSRYWFTIGH